MPVVDGHQEGLAIRCERQPVVEESAGGIELFLARPEASTPAPLGVPDLDAAARAADHHLAVCGERDAHEGVERGFRSCLDRWAEQGSAGAVALAPQKRPFEAAQIALAGCRSLPVEQLDRPVQVANGARWCEKALGQLQVGGVAEMAGEFFLGDRSEALVLDLGVGRLKLTVEHFQVLPRAALDEEEGQQDRSHETDGEQGRRHRPAPHPADDALDGSGGTCPNRFAGQPALQVFRQVRRRGIAPSRLFFQTLETDDL